MSSPQQIQNQLRPKKAGGNVWIYVILVVVGIVFAVITITALVIAIQRRPRQLYLKNPTTPNKEVFVVVFDEKSISAHKNSGNSVTTDASGKINPAVTAANLNPFSYPANPGDVTNLKNLINSGTNLEPFNGIASQIGKDLAIATKSNVEEALSKGAVFKYLKDESQEITTSGNYINLPFLIEESFSSTNLDDSPNEFYYIDDTASPKPTLMTSSKPAGTTGSNTRLAIAFYGVKPTFGDFVTRQYSTIKHKNNPTAAYLKTDATDYLPSATFKAPWIEQDVVYVYNFRIVPFNSTKFNDFVINNSSDYEAIGADGRIKWWSANYTSS